MTPEERQAFQNLLNAVRALEALRPEPVSETDPKLSECGHTLGSDYFRDETFPFCPKCGEKL